MRLVIIVYFTKVFNCFYRMPEIVCDTVFGGINTMVAISDNEVYTICYHYTTPYSRVQNMITKFSY